MLKPTVWSKKVQWNVGKAKDDKLSRKVWEVTEPFIFSKRNAIDVGTRFGGVAYYMCRNFDMTYCFDIKRKKTFPNSVIKEKVTHYHGPLGYKFKARNLKEWRSNPELGGRWHHEFIDEWLENIYNIDDFNFKDIDYYKIDTDGSEDAIIAGSEKTIKEYKPLIVCEDQHRDQKAAMDMLFDWGYKIVATNQTKQKDKVLLHESRL